jgi:hypothetical protein
MEQTIDVGKTYLSKQFNRDIGIISESDQSNEQSYERDRLDYERDEVALSMKNFKQRGHNNSNAIRMYKPQYEMRMRIKSRAIMNLIKTDSQRVKDRRT